MNFSLQFILSKVRISRNQKISIVFIIQRILLDLIFHINIRQSCESLFSMKYIYFCTVCYRFHVKKFVNF